MSLSPITASFYEKLLFLLSFRDSDPEVPAEPRFTIVGISNERIAVNFSQYIRFTERRLQIMDSIPEAHTGQNTRGGVLRICFFKTWGVR
jgi:hypothetical protein